MAAPPPPERTRRRILVTGGCGYIGSHTVASLLDPSAATSSRTDAEYDVVVVDNLANSSAESLRRAASLCSLDGFAVDASGTSGRDADGRLHFRRVDVADADALRGVFDEFVPRGGFDAAVHFAGLKAVGESTLMPLKYFEVNIGATLTLLKLMEEYGCRSIVFSSSATVYGVAKDEKAKLRETDEVGVTITNCYGRTKYMIEQILGDFHASRALLRSKRNDGDGDGATPKDWSVAILRYFNPAGAHPSGNMGEDPSGVPNNLMPFVAQVAVGRRPHVTVFGDDYDTPDGTGVRDYLHVVDLADGHVAALRYLDGTAPTGRSGAGKLSVFNLGTGTGYSVLDMLAAFGKAVGREIPRKMGPRRPGDVTIYMADPSLAREEMGWEARRDLDEMCRDLWSWQTKNPNGYGDE